MGYWLRGHDSERNNCFNKIQLFGQMLSQLCTWIRKPLYIKKSQQITNVETGAPNEKFWEKDLKQQQSVNKVFWDYFKHFGRLLEKNYLFLTPGKTDGRVPSQQTYNLQPDLLGSFIGHNLDLEWLK